MKTFADVRHLHIELSSKCNARCARCPRNYNGFPFNGGYEETNLSLERFQQVLSPEFLQQIEEILINGNYGDFVMNPDSIPIIEYILAINPDIKIQVSTNGSARDRKFWTTLGKMNIEIWFCLDGLADTHPIHRQDTDFDLIVKNATEFINAGGRATWKYIIFDHNAHQVEQARKLSQDLGFEKFFTINNVRINGPIYNREGKKIATIGNTNPLYSPDQITVEYIQKIPGRVWPQDLPTEITCEALQQRSVYISAGGAMAPCCYQGLGQQAQSQGGIVAIRDAYQEYLLKNENSDITTDRVWFPAIVESWNNKPHSICQHVCGKK
jgi:hypothetical protein